MARLCDKSATIIKISEAAKFISIKNTSNSIFQCEPAWQNQQAGKKSKLNSKKSFR